MEKKTCEEREIVKKEKEKPDWEGKGYSFFQNRACEYFPCHEGMNPDDFNCLFCYCPLYALGKKGGGNFTYTEKGIKNCTGCRVPHIRKNYGYIVGRFQEIAEIVKERS